MLTAVPDNSWDWNSILEMVSPCSRLSEDFATKLRPSNIGALQS
jgi:hypothetical protein